jgi:hypothetical protein
MSIDFLTSSIFYIPRYTPMINNNSNVFKDLINIYSWRIKICNIKIRNTLLKNRIFFIYVILICSIFFKYLHHNFVFTIRIANNKQYYFRTAVWMWKSKLPIKFVFTIRICNIKIRNINIFQIYRVQVYAIVLTMEKGPKLTLAILVHYQCNRSCTRGKQGLVGETLSTSRKAVDSERGDHISTKTIPRCGQVCELSRCAGLFFDKIFWI